MRESLKIKNIALLLLLGTLYATVFYLEMEAFKYLNSSVVDAIIFSSPLFLMLLYKIFDKAIFSKTIYLVVFVMIFAVCLMSDDQKASYPGHSLTGIFICLLAIIVYCFFLYFLDKVQSHQTIMPFFVIVCGYLISVLTAAFIFGKNMQVIPLITTDGSLLYAFLFCLISGVLPIISLGYSMRYIPVVLVDILQIFEPITTALAGALFLMEHITYTTLCGMALSLLVCLYITVSETVCSK